MTKHFSNAHCSISGLGSFKMTLMAIFMTVVMIRMIMVLIVMMMIMNDDVQNYILYLHCPIVEYIEYIVEISEIQII